MPDYSRFDQRVIGEILRRARVSVGLSIRGLAAESGVSPSHILRIESGEYDIRLSSLLKVAGCVGLPAGLILEQGLIVNTGTYAKIIGQSGIGDLVRDLPKVAPRKQANLIVFCAGSATTLAYVLHSSNPENIVSRVRFPGPQMAATFSTFAKELNAISIHDRLSIKRELETEPLDLLLRCKLVSPEIAMEYLEFASKGDKHFIPHPNWLI
jgi:transcriptional regulator with XRE-family HTH domain